MVFDANTNDIDPEINFQNLESIDNQCKYYTIDQINSQNIISSDFTLLNYNIRSFHTNGIQLECLLNNLNYNDILLTLTETWNHINNVNLCKIEGLAGFHTYRGNSRGGGVSIFCRTSYNAQKLDSFCVTSEMIL